MALYLTIVTPALCPPCKLSQAPFVSLCSFSSLFLCTLKMAVFFFFWTPTYSLFWAAVHPLPHGLASIPLVCSQATPSPLCLALTLSSRTQRGSCGCSPAPHKAGRSRTKPDPYWVTIVDPQETQASDGTSCLAFPSPQPAPKGLFIHQAVRHLPWTLETDRKGFSSLLLRLTLPAMTTSGCWSVSSSGSFCERHLSVPCLSFLFFQISMIL